MSHSPEYFLSSPFSYVFVDAVANEQCVSTTKTLVTFRTIQAVHIRVLDKPNAEQSHQRSHGACEQRSPQCLVGSVQRVRNK